MTEMVCMFTGMSVTTVDEEKEFNPRLTHPEDQFVKIMGSLGLAAPRKIGKT